MRRPIWDRVLPALVGASLAGCGGGLAAPPGVNEPASPVSAAGSERQPDKPPPAAALPDHLGRTSNPIVIPDCQLEVIQKEDVPGQQEGFLLFVGTEIKPGEQVPADRLLTIKLGAADHQFRSLKEDDVVEAGQLLGMLDDRLARDEWAIKNGKVAAGRADLAAAEKTSEEAEKRYETQMKLRTTNATSEEEVRGGRLGWEKAYYDVLSKREALNLAILELNQAQTMIQMHEIRTKIPGVIKTILKNPGEAVHRAEPVFQVHNLSRLRVEGLVEAEHLPRLRKGMRVVIEASHTLSPEQTLIGHLKEVTGVAVGKDPTQPLIVTASRDGTIRVWDRTTQSERRILRHPGPVRCVACTPPGAPMNWCLSGGEDGGARLWDVDGTKDVPLREFVGQHQGAITCVAFSLDGKLCATGGEDRSVCLWETGTGKLRYRLPAGHRGELLNLQFTSPTQLVSVGDDHTLRLWTLSEQMASLRMTLDHRSGDVTSLGASPAAGLGLFDQGQTLRILSLADGSTSGFLQTLAEGEDFARVALFSPDARLVLAGSSGGAARLDLWRVPTATTRGYPVRQLVIADKAPVSCCAFAPNGSFVVAGTGAGQVLVWPVPGREEVEQPLTAELTRIEGVIDANGRQVRIWAELANADHRLLPGATVTMAIDPQERGH